MKLKHVSLSLSALIVLVFQGWLIKGYTPSSAELPLESRSIEVHTAENSTVEHSVTEKSATEKSATEKSVIVKGWKLEWEFNRLVPDFIERKFHHIYIVRRGAILNGGNTVVDADIPLNSVSSFVQYFPRALQIGLLSPTPELWGGQGSTQAMTMARKVIGIIMPVFYICLLGAIIGIFIHRSNFKLWVMFFYSLFGILIYVYAYPNIGTLMRYRYVFHMTVISFGLATIVEVSLKALRTQDKQTIK